MCVLIIPLITKNILFFSLFSALETLQQNRRHSMFFLSVNLFEIVMCLEDLINYFAQPEDDIGNLISKSIFFLHFCYLNEKFTETIFS